MSELFRHFATKMSEYLGTYWAFMSSLLVVVLWAVTGPYFRWSDTWQMVINTGTTIVTFLMVFIVQTTQNRDARATHLKLDELIRVQKQARNNLANLEEASEADLAALEEEFRRLRQRAEKGLPAVKLP